MPWNAASKHPDPALASPTFPASSQVSADRVRGECRKTILRFPDFSKDHRNASAAIWPPRARSRRHSYGKPFNVLTRIVARMSGLERLLQIKGGNLVATSRRTSPLQWPEGRRLWPSQGFIPSIRRLRKLRRPKLGRLLNRPTAGHLNIADGPVAISGGIMQVNANMVQSSDPNDHFAHV
jgi:hypothetical protein